MTDPTPFSLHARQRELLAGLAQIGLLSFDADPGEVTLRKAAARFETFESGIARDAMDELSATLKLDAVRWRGRAGDDPTAGPKADGIELARTKADDYRWGVPSDPGG